MYKSCLMIQIKFTSKNVHLHFSYKGFIIVAYILLQTYLHCSICFITNLEFIGE